MIRRFGAVIALAGLILAQSAGAQDTMTIGIMQFSAKVGVSQDIVDVLADMVAEKITRMGNVRVVTRSDILALLDPESRARVVRASEEICFAEVGGALGVRYVVSGNLSRFEDVFLLNLKLTDFANAEVASRVSRRVRGGEAVLLDELLNATQELFEKVADRIQLVPTVTVASRRTQLLAESPSAVTVFTRKDIHRSGANSLHDLLRRIPGFDIYEMKPSFPLVGARALTEHSNNLILMLVDGREALIEMTGWPIWAALPFDLEEVERVEVIRGPGSTLYGANAFAGVVSITTVAERPADSGSVFLSEGEEGQQHLFGKVRKAWSLGPGTLSFGAGLTTRSRHSPSDRRNQIIRTNFLSHGHVRYRQDHSLDLSLHAGILDGGGTMFIIIGDYNTYDVVNHWVMAKAAAEPSDRTKLKAQLYHVRYVGNFHSRAAIQSYGIRMATLPDFYVDHHIVDGQLQLDMRAGEQFLLIGGVNLRFSTLGSDVMLPSRVNELRGGAFLHAQWNPWETVQVTGGLRFDLNSETEPALSPRAVAVFKPWRDHSFRLGYGLAYRKPSMMENQMHARIENAAFPEVIEKLETAISNGDLVNEMVHSIEAGWRGRFFDDRLRVSADIFCNIYDKMIYFKSEMELDSLGAPNILGSTFQYLNEDSEVMALGGEVEAAVLPAKNLSFFANLGLRKVKDLDTGRHMSSEPAIRLNLGARHAPDTGLTADLVFHYVSTYQMPFTPPDKTFEDPSQVRLGNVLLLIGRLGYLFSAGDDAKLEAGLTVRAPVGSPFREYPGIHMLRNSESVTASDFGGEELVRLASFYLRGSF